MTDAPPDVVNVLNLTRCHCRLCGVALSPAAAAWYESGLRHGRAEVFQRLRIGIVGSEADYELRPVEAAAP
jgi:hypothetical protein